MNTAMPANALDHLMNEAIRLRMGRLLVDHRRVAFVILPGYLKQRHWRRAGRVRTNIVTSFPVSFVCRLVVLSTPESRLCDSDIQAPYRVRDKGIRAR
ncbi:hypothetical protein BCh11DRAFT_07569 [Burkholderia sp. Ch1-1]|nr:hypothetical protein BCh11DRAFT_07569 [Burkholderia sp. Ch1-1]